MAEGNNQMPNGNPWPPSFVFNNPAPVDPASNFLQTFINIQQQQQQPQPPHNHQLIHPHQLHQRQIHQQPYERIPTTFPPVQQLPSLPPPPVTTTSILTQMPSEGNHFTFAGFGNEFNNRNISTPRPVPRNAATNRWNDNGSAFTELTPASQEATAPSIRGQSSLGLPCVGRNYLGRSAALMPPVEPSRNPFRLSALPPPSPYARPRTRRFPTTTANKIIRKRTVTPATNNLNFMRAFLDANPTLPPPPPITPMMHIDVHFVPQPEQFETPGACAIQQIRNPDYRVPESMEEEKPAEGGEDDEAIDVEK